MSAPRPEVIERLAERALAGMHQAVVDYGFLYPSAFTRPRRGDGERVATSDEPNLSDLMVGTVAAIRHDVESAARELFEAYRRVEIAQARLNDAASRFDSKAPIADAGPDRASVSA